MELNEIRRSVMSVSDECQYKDYCIKSIRDWLLESWSSTCKISLQQPIPEEEYIFRDYNNEMYDTTS